MATSASSHSPQSCVNGKSVCFHGDLHFGRSSILVLNQALDNLHVPHEVNEQTIENYLESLEILVATDRPVYWLAMSRLLELSLICAGHYADNCEFSVAGDLLVNPRKILIHRKGYPYPLIKHRHGRLTDQLNNKGVCRDGMLLYLKTDVSVEVTRPAVLPYLLEQIEQSGFIASWYLHDIKERMKKIADTIGFLSAWSLSGFEDLYHRLQKISSDALKHTASFLPNRSGFKTFNRAQGQGGLKRPTAGISGIFRGLDVSFQHRD
jgi:hypothetical protein